MYCEKEHKPLNDNKIMQIKKLTNDMHHKYHNSQLSGKYRYNINVLCKQKNVSFFLAADGDGFAWLMYQNLLVLIHFVIGEGPGEVPQYGDTNDVLVLRNRSVRIRRRPCAQK